MRIFILTLQFLTRIPINLQINANKEDFAKGIIYFPFIGFIIGGFNLLVYIGADYLIPGIFPIICCLLANCMITGALHIDGLADTCDGLFSARSKERMLEIMKDSRIGTNGAIAITFDFLLRVSLLQSFDSGNIIVPILLSPVIAKTLVGFHIGFSKDARTGGGMGSLFMEKATNFRAISCLAIGTAIVLFFAQIPGLITILSSAVILFLFKSYVYSKIDGMTGDTLGAANEIIEISFLFFYAVMWRFFM